ncbi:MAG: chromate transporter [Fervidobacterium sp.]|nr:chromate transporter [Fervidobacterium sp.]
MVKLKKEGTTLSLWKIFSITAKVGGVTIGGGYAMVPVIREEFVTKNKLLSDEEFTSLLVIAQSLPGPIAVNTSALVGYKLRKIQGTISAVVGAIFFPTLIILAIAALVSKFYNILSPFLRGMKIPLFSVLLVSVLKMWKSNVREIEDIIIFIISFTFVSFFKLNPVFIILLTIFYSLIRGSFKNRDNVKEGDR